MVFIPMESGTQRGFYGCGAYVGMPSSAFVHFQSGVYQVSLWFFT